MRASEVDFLRAEGALAGFDMGGGTPQQYYESGIRKSFAECGASIGSYLNSTTPPLAFTDPVNAAYNYTAPSIITVKWNEADDVEKNWNVLLHKSIWPSSPTVKKHGANGDVQDTRARFLR